MHSVEQTWFPRLLNLENCGRKERREEGRKEGRKEDGIFCPDGSYSNYVLGNIWTRNNYLGKVSSL